MNEVKNGANSVAAQPVPLFASSWIALYSFLRSSLAGQPEDPKLECTSQDPGEQPDP
ncbi:MAG: hypothetical protein HKN58_10445 [Xanthomonadales bacterium]|nr:hypothetical protein [Xanthomonadales bacterium]